MKTDNDNKTLYKKSKKNKKSKSGSFKFKKNPNISNDEYFLV